MVTVAELLLSVKYYTKCCILIAVMITPIVVDREIQLQ